MKWISALDLTKTNFDVKYFLSETLRASSIKSYNIFALFFFSLKSSYFFLKWAFISYSLLFCGRLISTCFQEKFREKVDTVLKGEEKKNCF